MTKPATNSIYLAWKNGDFDRAIELEVTRYSIIEYCKIYEEYIQIREQGYNYREAVQLTAERMILTEAKVKVAIAAVI